MANIPTVLVYAVRDDEVLVMRRNKEPNLGLWIAPGGKIERGESPHEAARREMEEETGLVVEDLAWRGFCTEVSPLPTWQWWLFIYVTRRFEGAMRGDRREGHFAWVDVDTYLSELPIPQADAVFAPRVLDPDEGMFEAKFVYDADLKLVEWVRY
ncbi:MAG: NUDIX domain-containing protein [Anaerolineae bacterium]